MGRVLSVLRGCHFFIHEQCFIGYSGRIGSRGQKTAACQTGMLGELALIQYGRQNT